MQRYRCHDIQPIGGFNANPLSNASTFKQINAKQMNTLHHIEKNQTEKYCSNKRKKKSCKMALRSVNS